MLTSGQYLGLESSHLVPVAEGHALMPQVAAAFIQMQAAARAEGIDLSIASSFRDFQRQKVIWNGKWRAERAVQDLHGNPVDVMALNAHARMRAILTFSAVPGCSRHHWGTDLDVFDAINCARLNHKLQLLQHEYEGDGPCAALSRWIDQHGHEFGFYRPYAEFHGAIAVEPWHLSYQPLAEQIAAAIELPDVAETIRLHEIEGAECILLELETIFQRYVLNKVSL